MPDRYKRRDARTAAEGFRQGRINGARPAAREPRPHDPDDLVIATKVGPGRDPSGEWLPHATPGQLRGQVEENLRQLGLDHLDVVNLRIVGTDSIAERFGALAELREAGLIRHLGLSNVRPHHLAEALAIAPVVCVQNMYGIGASPEQEELLRSPGGETGRDRAQLVEDLHRDLVRGGRR
nr:aldo/keto reductase [Streptomyces sp. ICC1]